MTSTDDYDEVEEETIPAEAIRDANHEQEQDQLRQVENQTEQDNQEEVAIEEQDDDIPDHVSHGTHDNHIEEQIMEEEWNNPGHDEYNAEEAIPTGSDEEARCTPRYNLRHAPRDYGYRFDRVMSAAPEGAKTYETHEQHLLFTQIHGMDLRSSKLDAKKQREYDHEYLIKATRNMDDDSTDMMRFVTHYLFAQLGKEGINPHKMMSEREGMAKYGERAVAALASEFAQFDSMDLLGMVDVSKLTRKQKRMALRAINTIKLKRCGKIKGRTVADGRTQHSLYDKSETSSAACHNDPLMLTMVVEAKERRCVGTGDVPGAYLHAYMKDFVLIKFIGHSVEILCKQNPEY